MTALQYTALTVLERHPDLTAAHLARHSFVTGQSMADMVTALLNRGLIERHRDPADRRRLVIALTRAGERLLATDASAGRGAGGSDAVAALGVSRPASCGGRTWSCAGWRCASAAE